MTKTSNAILILLFFSCGSFAGEPPSATSPQAGEPVLTREATPVRAPMQPPRRASVHTSPPASDSTAGNAGTRNPAAAVSKPLPALMNPSSSRTVAYKETDVIPIATRVRFSTLILLPKTERILDFTTGDKDFWAISGSENVAYVKPAREHSQTNLNLLTASGNVYSFVLTETSGQSETPPDLKVFVEAAEPRMAENASGPPRFVAASQIEDYRQQIEIAKEETRDAKQGAQTAIDRSIDKFRAGYPTNLKFVYRVERDRKPFLVTAMYHDDKFTYIRATPQETPVVYELKDGKPNLINFEYRDGTYVLPKIVDGGYLSVGKEKLSFRREE